MRGTLSSFIGLALLIGACPRRQHGPLIVYVPAAPPATTSGTPESTGTLVIEEPPPPEPTGAVPEPSAAPRPARRPRRAIRLEPDTVEVTPEPVEPPPTAEVPALEPRETREEEAELRREIAGLQKNIQQQIAQLARLRLDSSDRKTLEDAKRFLAQSEKALEEGDLQRSFNLARKAYLLVAALKQQP